MEVYIYSDESGVFDKKNNDFYVYGGIILLGKQAKDEWTRRYIKAETDIRSIGYYKENTELKASILSNKHKGKLFRSLNQPYKFASIVNQNSIRDEIFKTKKHKQRYLDYVYKITVKRAISNLITKGIIEKGSLQNLNFYIDEHSTATNGRYELQEGLLQELKHGTFNYQYTHFFEPLLPDLKSINLSFCNSEKTTLIRAADIIANKVYFYAVNNIIDDLKCDNLFIDLHP